MNTLYSAVAGLALALGATSLGNSILPVVAGMRASLILHEGHVVTAYVTGRKLKDCHVVSGSFVGWYRSAGIWHEAPVEFVNDMTPNSSRPAGWERQDFGIWRWRHVPDTADAVRVSLQHECGASVRSTVAGPFEIS